MGAAPENSANYTVGRGRKALYYYTSQLDTVF